MVRTSFEIADNFEKILEIARYCFCFDSVSPESGCATDRRLGKHVWTKGNCRRAPFLRNGDHPIFSLGTFGIILSCITILKDLSLQKFFVC